MINRYARGVVPPPGAFGERDRALLDAAYALPAAVRAHLADFALHQILADVWAVVGEANRYFTAEEPWAKRKTDPDRMATVLHVTAEVLRVVAILVQPVMPTAMATLLDQLGVAPAARLYAHADPGHALQEGTPLPQPAAVFPRYVEPEAPLT